MSAKLMLYRGSFIEKERIIMESGSFTASTFCYDSGIEAVRIKNKKGEFIWLPFKGQQIWRASFCGRELTMRSMFDEPTTSDEYGATYGGFMLHCGMTAIGHPLSPADKHPLHGELPNIVYDSAYIEVGEDSGGKYVIAGGSLSYKRAFTIHYVATPQIKLYEDGTIFDLLMTVENKRANPMEYSYMSHVNFCAIEGAKLVYDAECVKIHKKVPDTLPAQKANALRDYMEKLSENPSIQDVLDSKTQVYEPEIVFTFDFKADENGWAHCKQIAPDGSADYIAYRVKELPIGVRWFARTAEEDALGMVLPTTAEHLGYTYSKENGQIKVLGAGESVTFFVKAGYLEAGEV